MTQTRKKTTTTGRVAWVAGATGLVGRHLIEQLSSHPDYSDIIAFVRKQSDANWLALPKVRQHIVDYNALNAPSDHNTVDDLFCALGTTKAKTPDPDQYYTIDVTYPLNFAELGLTQGAQCYAVVSAHGANKNSFSSYLKMKGELELKLQLLSYPHLVIARPGLLKGDRGEFRPLERMSEYVTNLLPGNLRSIHARDVAASLIRNTLCAETNVVQLASKTMQGAFGQ